MGGWPSICGCQLPGPSHPGTPLPGGECFQPQLNPVALCVAFRAHHSFALMSIFGQIAEDLAFRIRGPGMLVGLKSHDRAASCRPRAEMSIYGVSSTQVHDAPPYEGAEMDRAFVAPGGAELFAQMSIYGKSRLKSMASPSWDPPCPPYKKGERTHPFVGSGWRGAILADEHLWRQLDAGPPARGLPAPLRRGEERADAFAASAPARVFRANEHLWRERAGISSTGRCGPPLAPPYEGGETLGVPRVLSLAAWHSK